MLCLACAFTAFFLFKKAYSSAFLLIVCALSLYIFFIQEQGQGHQRYETFKQAEFQISEKLTICSQTFDYGNKMHLHVCNYNSDAGMQKFLLEIHPSLNLKFAEIWSMDLGCVASTVLAPDLANYYKIFKIYNVCSLRSMPSFVEDSPRLYYKFFALVDKLRQRILGVFLTKLHYPNADLAAGLILGYRANFDVYIKNKMNFLGLTHLIAISGYNVALFLLLIDRTLFFLNRRWRLYLYPFCLCVFVFITGLQASVIRACLMAQIQLLSLGTKRSYQAYDALLVVIVFMSLLNPARLYFDLGFWLSVLATLAIILFGDSARKYFLKIGCSEFFAEVLGLGLVSFCATSLISYVFFDNFNLFAIAANFMVAAVVPVLMFLSFFLINIKFDALEYLVSYFLNILLELFFFITDFALYLNLLLYDTSNWMITYIYKLLTS